MPHRACTATATARVTRAFPECAVPTLNVPQQNERRTMTAAKYAERMTRKLSNADGKPIRVFAATLGRLAYRYRWGHAAGMAAFKRGDDVNAFRERRNMPMHRGWDEGYQEAGNGRTGVNA